MNELHTVEDQLRAEIENLRRQLEQHEKLIADPQRRPPGKLSPWTLLVLALVAAGLIAAGFFKGYLPRQRREMALVVESKAESQTLPVVDVRPVTRSHARTSLLLPGNIQAVTEAPIVARASGYLRKRNVDIGDRVEAGQVLAEIEAPELQQQIRQATAALEQVHSAVQQAEASLEQGRANADLARVTAERWTNLAAKGVVSRQENDTYRSHYEAQRANVQALEKAVAAARSNVAAAEANLARLNQLQTYQTVRAPFAGVITVRNVDVGALVNEGNTLLCRIAQTDRLRTYLNVPQGDSEYVRVGEPAAVLVPDFPGRKFPGTVRRTANALDPSTRTLLVEVELPNPSGTLMPGMYAQVELSLPQKAPSLVIPAFTLVVRPDGPQVAVVGPDDRVHFTRIQLGRDYGQEIEVLSGLQEGQRLATNPSDAVREGVQVKPVTAPEAAGEKK